MPGLTLRAARKTAKTVRRYARTKRILHQPRKQTYPPGGKPSGPCSEVDCLNCFGPVSGGSVTLPYTIDGTTEDIEIQWNDDKEAVQTAYEGHSKIGEGNVKVVGGPWPAVALHVIFQGDLKGQTIEFPDGDDISDDLTGGGVFRMWKASSANWKGYDS
ncbi:hypothetical protein SH661x_002323 [Planctomicrobium sp. SH661]|uniref:hypothetical protein n=1 Tax=Planctomicrobium sp. SH661 TaxID=3448124 RepID=UPI003F5B2CE7